MTPKFVIPRSDFDDLARCGDFGRREYKGDGFSVVVCGQGGQYRARVWIGMEVQLTGIAEKAGTALLLVVETDPPYENRLNLSF